MFRRLLLTALVSLFAMPFSVSAQEAVAPVEPPAFLEDVKSQEDFDKLTSGQKQQAEEFFKNNLVPSPSGSQVDNPAGTVACFDYYHFGSVSVDLSSTLSATVPGATLGFTGTVKNANSYPVIDGQIYVKIFRKDGEASLVHQNGYALVDQFALPETFTLPAGGGKDASFAWEVPENAPTGDYMAAFFFQTAKRYNLLGLSFTDDVTGNQAQFSVENSADTGVVAFDKNSVTKNGEPHRFAAFLSHFTKDEPVTIKAKLVNPRDEIVVVPVSWKLYVWDSLREETLKNTQTELVTLNPKETKELAYVVKPIDESVSYLVAETKDGETGSLLDIRFVRDGVEETRINFPGLMDFPLKQGKESTLFSCVHSTNMPVVQDNILTLTLRDEQGALIHTYKYQGDITGAMMGVKDAFTPDKTYDNFTLTATLERKGKVVEEVTGRYSCQDIDPNLCAKPGSGIAPISAAGRGVVLAVLAVLTLLLGVLAWKLWKNKHNKGMKAFLFLSAIFLSGAFLFGGAKSVEAKSVVWTSAAMPWLYEFYDNSATNYTGDSVPLTTSPACPSGDCGWVVGLNSGSVATVRYHAVLTNIDTGVNIVDGTAVPVGTRFTITPTPYTDTDISWVGTGAAYDSPYGNWVAAAGPVADACHAEDFTDWQTNVGFLGKSTTYGAFILLNVNPPASTLFAPSSNLSCVGNTCTVTGSGPVSLGMNFANTEGKFYYRYNFFKYQYACRANNVPMRTSPSYILSCMSTNCLPSQNEFILNVPAQQVNFTLTATGPANAAPTIPLIKGSSNMITPAPATGFTDTSYAFYFRSTDPDGNTIRYGIDWDNNGSVDEWAPVFGHVASGTTQTRNKSWPTVGVKTFQVLAQDSNGASSGWASHSIVITAPVVIPAPTFTFTANPTSIIAGNSSLLSWTTSNAQSCWLSGGGIGSWAALPTGNRSVSPAVTTTYSLECWNASGVSSGVQSRTVTVTAPTYSCTGTIPANASMFANDNVGLSVNTPYTYWPTDTGTRCQYSCNGGYNWNGSACVPPVSTLKVCLNSCNSGSSNFNGQTVDLAPNDTRRYVACYNAASGCNAASGDITADASTTFSATNTPSDAVTPTATKGEFRANAVPVTRSESVSVGTSQGSASVTLRVTPVCVSGCSAQAGNHCQGETFTTTNSCGASETCTNAGTRYCDFNWKEVAPGN